jgi:hypothetical protein
MRKKYTTSPNSCYLYLLTLPKHEPASPFLRTPAPEFSKTAHGRRHFEKSVRADRPGTGYDTPRRDIQFSGHAALEDFNLIGITCKRIMQ